MRFTLLKGNALIQQANIFNLEFANSFSLNFANERPYALNVNQSVKLFELFSGHTEDDTINHVNLIGVMIAFRFIISIFDCLSKRGEIFFRREIFFEESLILIRKKNLPQQLRNSTQSNGAEMQRSH